MPGHDAQTFYRYFPAAQRDRDWGLFVTTVGESKIRPGSTYPPGGHPRSYDFRASAGRRLHEHQIIYISAGQGWFKTVGSGRIKIGPGAVILLFPGVWHSYAPTDAVGWNEHWVGFNGDIARRLIKKGFFGPDRSVLRAGEESRLLELFNDLLETTRANQPALQQLLAGTVVRMLALLYSVQQSHLAGDDPALQIIHRAVIRLRENPEASLKIPDLARELNVGYRWFRRAFTHYTGLSPHQYFLDVRLARARDLLAQTSHSTKEIAVRTGFDDAQYFCRLFHKKVGLTPSGWRSRAQRGSRD